VGASVQEVKDGMSTLRDELTLKIKRLNETIWEGRVQRKHIDLWMDNFEADVPGTRSERLHALHLLSQFMYFGNREMRELVKALYRDLFKYPIVQRIRKSNANTKDVGLIERELKSEIRATRFLGIGNPSESGTHLLYYFRQENRLPKDLFINSHDAFTRTGPQKTLALRDSTISRYVFIDDFTGSGNQAVGYAKEVVEDLKHLKPNVEVSYYVLFATSIGLGEIRAKTKFDNVHCIYELDDSYKCFSPSSRYYVNTGQEIDKPFAESTCKKHGFKLLPSDPLGYEDGQLLLGLFHNTPDNTLPIIWYDEPEGQPWQPIFRRYPKIYGW
jgi:hypothetical protein